MRSIRMLCVGALLVALTVAAGIGVPQLQMARAGQVAILPSTTPIEPSQTIGTINSVIQTLNNAFGMLNGSGADSATGTGTAEQTLASYTLPGNVIATYGAIRQKCWGIVANNANVKTVKLYFGGQSYTVTPGASAATTWAAEGVTIRTGAATQRTMFQGIQGVTNVAVAKADGTDDLTAAVTLKCTGTDGTSSAADITVQGYLVEVIK